MEWFKKNWKFLAVVAVAVLVLSVVIVIAMPDQNIDTPIVDDQPSDSAENGVYYYDTAEGEYVLSLSNSNVFTIAGPSLNKSGTYTVTANGYELDFIRDEDGIGTITKDGTALTLKYKDMTMRFLEKVTYAVNFNVDGGSAVETVNVLNGKTVSKPADPQKEGSVFIGWYADAACTTLYDFSAQAITANTTVYAKWAQPVVGQSEYVVDFDLGYEVEGYEAMSTIGGKLYNVPTPQREGYTFGGWWISMTEKGDQLTYKYNEELVFQANTTLFAVWQQAPASGKLENPAVEVFEDTIRWNSVKGASVYNLKITDLNGNVVKEEPVGNTTKNYNFSELPAGEYIIELTAVGSVADKTSETVVRRFVNKALNRVSLFTVVDGGLLLWNSVEGAEKYLVTVKCGDPNHEHVLFDNGASTTYLFTGCAMQPGGIEFIVTAVAEGKANSVSETFVYDRKLDAVGEILYNEETQSFYWTAVANASKYMISINGDERLIDNGSATTFSVKHLSGKITLSVVPYTQGYNSPEATTTEYTKESLATPNGLTVSGNVVTWNAVEGATGGYMVKINGQAFPCETNALDLDAIAYNLEVGLTYDISVMAVGASSSLYSEVLSTTYLGDIANVSYNNHIVTWTPVLGAKLYEVRVNGIVVATNVEGDSAVINLNRAGANVIEVRYTDMGRSNWSSTKVNAFEVIYNTRSGSGTRFEYLAIGDTMNLPDDLVMAGYDFTGWYNSPDGAAGNGAVFAENQKFNGTGTLMLYGNWTPKTFHVEFAGVAGATNITEGEKLEVKYLSSYKLPVPENPNSGGEFVGWYTLPGASGVPLTDSQGNCLNIYGFTDNTYAYPYFDTGVLTYEMQADGNYAVKKGPNIASAKNVRIPEFYKGKKVTTIMENAFYGVTTMEKLEIPATIVTIGTGAIPTSATLREIVVYTEVSTSTYETFYSSYDGALLRHDMGTVYLEAFPRGKTGTYTIPDEVNVIRDKVFRFAGINKLIVGNGVTLIMQNAFYQCSSLQTLEFKAGGDAPLTIDPAAFYNTKNLRTIRLPARLEQMDLQILSVFTRLSVIEVEEGGRYYSSVDNMICNAAGDAILYAPMGISGDYTIPKGVVEIGANAFTGRTNITKLTIPSSVNVIGANAFQGCTGITEILIEGGRTRNLQIDAAAFYGCNNVVSVTFQGNSTPDIGVTTIGLGAFESMEKLQTVTFEAGCNVTIGDSAFANNANLQKPVYNEGAIINSIGNNAFMNCVKIDEVYIPATVSSVGASAFSGCSEVLNVVFAPNGKQVTFGSNVFNGCKKLKTVTLPATITKFDSTAFAGCIALENIVVDENNQHLVSYEGALYTKDYSELLFYPKALDGDMNKLHENLQKIGDKVFEGNAKITSIKLTNKITYIGQRAFYGCYNLASVTIAQDGTALTIGQYAFYNCSALQSIQLPAYTSEIGASAFEMSGLTSFTIPAGVTALPANMLKNTKIQSIEIPANVVSIGDGVFANCSKLQTVTFAPGGVQPLTLGTLTNTNKTNGVFYGTIITNLTLDNRVTQIGAYAFYNQKKLTTLSMTAESQLTDIGKYAFAVESGTSTLRNITLGNKVSTIADHAFYKARFSSINLPNSVTLIGEYAFASQYLTNVNFAMTGASELSFDLTIGKYAFANTKIETIKFPASLTSAYTFIDLSQYAGAGTAKNFFYIFEGNTVLKSIEVEDGCKNFASIDGILYERDVDGNPTILLYCPRAKTGDVTIAKEVRKVENGAFANTSITNVFFEEYDRNHANYGKPLLEIGNGVLNTDFSIPTNLAVFSPSSNPAVGGGGGGKDERSNDATVPLTSIQLPSHLGRLGVECFYNMSVTSTPSGGGGGFGERSITRNGSTGVTFNLDAHLSAISGRAFDRCSGITVLNLPAVDELGYGAFTGLTALTSITFGAGSQFKTLPDSLFKGCTALTTFTVPASVTRMGTYVFHNCTSLSTIHFEQGSQLVEIGARCFMGSGLTSLTLPDSVEFVGENPFSGCTKLRVINLSRNLTAISTAMFNNCAALEAINIADDSPYFKSVDGVLYDLKQTAIFAFPMAKDATNFQLPATVTRIERYAFSGFMGESLVLPDGLETIGEYAFLSSHLKSIHIPASVKSIGANAFYQQNPEYGISLESLTFAPDSQLTVISQRAFRGNTKLKVVDLPDNINLIEKEAFSQCTALENVMLPAALDTLQEYAFYDCPNLKEFVMQEGLTTIGKRALHISASFTSSALTELYIPASVTSLGESALRGQYGLKTVTFAPNSRLSTIGASAFEDCVSLESITLPASVNTLQYTTNSGTINGVRHNVYDAMTFQNCKSLKYVDMSACAALTNLSGRMFADCTSIETLLLPPNVTKIGDFFFGTKEVDNWGRPQVHSMGLTSLKEIEIPASVTYIGGYAFYGCTSLETVTFAAGSQLAELGTTTVNAATPFAGKYIFANTPALKNVVLPETVTTIGISCFENSAVESVNLPSGVKTIGACAFKNCANIKAAALSANLQYLGDEAFFNCYNLETAELSFGLEYLGSMAFGNCRMLKSAHIPATVNSISGNPFMGCVGLEHFDVDPDNANYTVDELGVMYDKNMYTLLCYPAFIVADTYEIPSTVNEIAPGAFAGAQLKSVVIPDRFTTLPEYVFSNSAIESVTFHRGITVVGDHAFDGCANLNNVTVLNTMKDLGDYAFANCTSLSNFVFEDIAEGTDPYYIGTHFFDGCTAMTQVTLPNIMISDGENGQATDRMADYMFANTGIVHAVIPARVTDISTIGAFFNCKQMLSVNFETMMVTEDGAIGSLFFYGCSSLKEVVIPYGCSDPFGMINGHTEPGLYSCGSYIFGECTSLEKVTVYVKNGFLSTGMFTFYNCSSLTEINILKVNDLVYDDQGNVIGYENVVEHCFGNSLTEGAFHGCSSLKKVNIFRTNLAFWGNPFAGSGFETLHFEYLRATEGYDYYGFDAFIFEGMPNLKEIFIGYFFENLTAVRIHEDTFKNLETDVNIYFYQYTRAEVEELLGGDMAWLTNASEKAHFIFKDEMSEDVEIPECIGPSMQEDAPKDKEEGGKGDR